MINRKKNKNLEIYPDEIFLDSQNIPRFDTQQMEGRLEKPISKKIFHFFFFFTAIAFLFFIGKIFQLQIIKGEYFLIRADKNLFRAEILLPPRAVVTDRNGVKLIWNDNNLRIYSSFLGLAHILGYIGLPSSSDLRQGKNILLTANIGKDGIEKQYENLLRGIPGKKLVERDSQNNIISENFLDSPASSEPLILTIDSKLEEQFFKIIDAVASDYKYQGGAGVILDVNNGEMLSLVSWPEYNSQILSSGAPEDKIKNFLNDKKNPFLNRAISGLYAPGSIIKPLIAIAALNEEVVSPEKRIFSAGYISIPNPFFPDKESVFKDWKAHGWVDMKRAIAVSSDVYFYEVGGGYENITGVGIKKIEEYARMFGWGSETGIDLGGEKRGTVPSPELKKEFNPNDPIWRVGDTYNASIGQGYFHVTPIEMAVYAAALANNGKIIKPHLINIQGLPLENSKGNPWIVREINISRNYFDIVRQGMRMAVTEGTASILNVWDTKIAAKTGTAEIGAAKKYVNSWVIGFWPYENPKYAFVVVMEKGPHDNVVNASYVMRQLFDWMSIYTPEYLK